MSSSKSLVYFYVVLVKSVWQANQVHGTVPHTRVDSAVEEKSRLLTSIESESVYKWDQFGSICMWEPFEPAGLIKGGNRLFLSTFYESLCEKLIALTQLYKKELKNIYLWFTCAHRNAFPKADFHLASSECDSGMVCAQAKQQVALLLAILVHLRLGKKEEVSSVLSANAT